MRPHNWALVILLLLLAVHGIHLDVAFNRDWVSYPSNLYSPIRLWKNTLGISNDAVYSLNDRNELQYFVDLTLHEGSAFQVVGLYIVTYSSFNEKVSFHRVSNGVFIDSVLLESPPVLIKYTEGGILLLQKDRQLALWNELSLATLGGLPHEHFDVFQYDAPYITSGGSLFRVFEGKLQELETDTQLKSLLSMTIVSPSLPLSENFFCVFSNGLYVFKYDTKLNQLLSHFFFEEELKFWFFAENQLHVSTLEEAVRLNPLFLVGNEDFASSPEQNTTVQDKISLIYRAVSMIANSPKDPSDTDRYFGIPEFRVEEIDTYKPTESYSATGKAILIDKPLPIADIEMVHHMEHDLQSSALARFISRCITHLSHFGKYAITFWKPCLSDQGLSRDEEFHIGSLLIYLDKERNVLVAKNVRDGTLFWTFQLPLFGELLEFVPFGEQLTLISEKSYLKINTRNGSLVSKTDFPHPVSKIFQFSSDDSEPCIGVKEGSTYKVLDCEKKPLNPYLVDQNKNTLQAFKLANESLLPTWEYGDDNENIIAVQKNHEKVLNAVGIARYDKSILYKFLNPNLAAVVRSRGEDLRLTLLDGVLGRFYYSSVVTSEKTLIDSVQIVVRDNWVVLSYTVSGSSIEQRITIYDLFTDFKMAHQKEVSSFEEMLVNVSSKTYLFPEKIVALSATESKFGITTKSILALTEGGSLVEIPKHILNSRRIDDRQMTQNDYLDDFRMSPYQPIIAKDALKVLNHKHKLLIHSTDKILVLPTELESTAVVCMVNKLNDFCSVVQPSLSYDTLPKSFKKVTLLLTLAALLAGYVVSLPFVHLKRLNDKWLD